MDDLVRQVAIIDCRSALNAHQILIEKNYRPPASVSYARGYAKGKGDLHPSDLRFLGTRQVQHWVARLTLVAYLIGGWIVPSIHNHASHGHGAHLVGSHGTHAACAATNQVAKATAAEASDHGCSCEHLHVSSTKQSDESVSLISIESSSSEHSDCFGLCAVCSARSLTTHRIVDPLPSILVLVVASVRIQDSVFADIDRVGISLSRGPPTFV